MICQSMKPYPEVKVSKKNREYAKLLMEDYAGISSEESAIHLYLYQNLILKDDDWELRDALMEISKVEMYHLYILGTVIMELGEKPIFGESKDELILPWNSSYVDYTTNIKRMLLVDIEREEAAIKNYREHIRCIDDENIKEILRRIIEDEELHLDIFHYFLGKL